MLRYGENFDDVPLVVNVAGRFDTRETPRSRFTEEQWDKLETTGSFQWNVKVLCVCHAFEVHGWGWPITRSNSFAFLTCCAWLPFYS